jgi:hypothetical protein
MTHEPITIRKSTGEDISTADALFCRSYPALLAPDYAPDVLSAALPLMSRANPKLLRSGD